MQDLTLPSVELIDGQPMTTSLAVADHFEKLHKNVVRDIRELERGLKIEPTFREQENSLKSSESQHSFHALNFEPTFREIAGPHGSTRQEPYFRMTKDGFALLAMGFTGERALRFKINYINAFNTLAETVQVQQAEMLRLRHENDLLTRLVTGSEPAELALKVQQYATEELGAPVYPTAPEGLFKIREAAEIARTTVVEFRKTARMLGMNPSAPTPLAHLSSPGQWSRKQGVWDYQYSQAEIEMVRKTLETTNH